MAPTLVHTVKTYFTSDFTQQAAELLNEHRSHIAKALEAVIPAMLAGMLNRATSGREDSQNIFERSKEEAANFRISHDVKNLLADTQNDTLSQDIFGTDRTFIEESIAGFAEIKKDSVSTLIRLMIPGILGLLGKHDGRKELSANGLAGFLSSQRNDIIEAIPSRLTSFTDVLGLGTSGIPVSLLSQKKENRESKKTDAVSKKSSWQIKWMVLLVIVLLIVITVRVARC